MDAEKLKYKQSYVKSLSDIKSTVISIKGFSNRCISIPETIGPFSHKTIQKLSPHLIYSDPTGFDIQLVYETLAVIGKFQIACPATVFPGEFVWVVDLIDTGENIKARKKLINVTKDELSKYNDLEFMGDALNFFKDDKSPKGNSCALFSVMDIKDKGEEKYTIMSLLRDDPDIFHASPTEKSNAMNSEISYITHYTSEIAEITAHIGKIKNDSGKEIPHYYFCSGCGGWFKAGVCVQCKEDLYVEFSDYNDYNDEFDGNMAMPQKIKDYITTNFGHKFCENEPDRSIEFL